jgi:hypothetical protein
VLSMTCMCGAQLRRDQCLPIGSGATLKAWKVAWPRWPASSLSLQRDVHGSVHGHPAGRCGTGHGETRYLGNVMVS